MGRKKRFFAISAFLVLMVAGLYLSGYLTLLLLKADTGSLKWNTCFGYWRSLHLPQWQPYAGQIRLAAGVGFCLPLLAWLTLLAPMLRPTKQTMHGDMHFAGARDLAKHGLFKRSDNGIVIPNLLDYRESMVVLDIKQENFDPTNGWRASQGQEICPMCQKKS